MDTHTQKKRTLQIRTGFDGAVRTYPQQNKTMKTPAHDKGTRNIHYMVYKTTLEVKITRAMPAYAVALSREHGSIKADSTSRCGPIGSHDERFIF